MKTILGKLIRPGLPWVFLGALSIPFFMTYTFGFGHEDTPLAYLGYLVMAYSLLIIVVFLSDLARQHVLSRLVQAMDRLPLFHRLRHDPDFKSWFLLLVSLFLNVLYSLMNLGIGYGYQSFWFVTLGAYYLLLTILRTLLLWGMKPGDFGKDRGKELGRQRLTGFILLLLDIILTGMVILVFDRSNHVGYQGYLILVIAPYTFFLVISAFIHLIKEHRAKSPVLATSKAVSFASALVSMLMLEIAMLDRYGEADGKTFQDVFIARTAFVIILINLGISLWLVRSASGKKAS